MNNWLTTTNVLFVIVVLSTAFNMYQGLRKPQESEEKKSALLAQQVKFAADAVAQRFIDLSQATETRFKNVQDSFNQLLLQSNNHIHTVDTKVDTLNGNVSDLSIKVATLTTIIDERIPKKTD